MAYTITKNGFQLHLNFINLIISRYSCSLELWKSLFKTLYTVVLNLQVALGNMDILMMLIIPIHEHGTRFHLFVSCSISFFSVVQFSEYRPFTSLVKFMPRYLIFCWQTTKGEKKAYPKIFLDIYWTLLQTTFNRPYSYSYPPFAFPHLRQALIF